jgi:hypothetical protein
MMFVGLSLPSLGILLVCASCLSPVPKDTATAEDGTGFASDETTTMPTLPGGNATTAEHPLTSSSPNVPPPTKPVADPIAEVPENPPVVVDGLDRYTLVGRFDITDPNAIPITHLSSKIGLRFTGTSLGITMTSTQINAFNVVIDGKLLPKIVLPKNILVKTTYPIATDLPQGLHTAWVTKATEYTYGCGKVTLFDMVIDSNASFMSPPRPKKRRIEIVGDSSFSSFGVEGLYIVGDPNHPQCSPVPANENADYAIPAYIAQSLDAELYNLSCTGRGVVESANDSSKDPNHLLPFIYNHLIGGDYTKLYDFKMPMDVVILSAGGNDFLGASGSGKLTDRTKFVTTYANWLLRIRGYYPNALIVAAMSPNAKNDDRINMLSVLTDAVHQAQTANGPRDENMIMFDYFANDPNNWTVYDHVANAGGYGWGCRYHTSVTGSKWLAERMAPMIKANRGW